MFDQVFLSALSFCDKMSQSGMIGTIMRSLKYIMDISKVVVLDWKDTTSGQSLSDGLIKWKKYNSIYKWPSACLDIIHLRLNRIDSFCHDWGLKRQ